MKKRSPEARMAIAQEKREFKQIAPGIPAIILTNHELFRVRVLIPIMSESGFVCYVVGQGDTEKEAVEVAIAKVTSPEPFEEEDTTVTIMAVKEKRYDC